MRALILVDKRNIVPSILILLILTMLVLVLSPAEAILGNLVKLVFLHVAVVFLALGLFFLAGLLSLIFLTSRKMRFFKWASVFETTAIFAWVINVFLGALVTYLAWGGLFWAEPRARANLTVLVLALIFYLLAHIVKSPQVISFFNLIIAFTAGYLIFTAERVFHPENPLGASSGILMMKIATFTIFILLLLVFLQFARLIEDKGYFIGKRQFQEPEADSPLD